jgi:hypothetical protein
MLQQHDSLHAHLTADIEQALQAANKPATAGLSSESKEHLPTKEGTHVKASPHIQTAVEPLATSAAMSRSFTRPAAPPMRHTSIPSQPRRKQRLLQKAATPTLHAVAAATPIAGGAGGGGVRSSAALRLPGGGSSGGGSSVLGRARIGRFRRGNTG